MADTRTERADTGVGGSDFRGAASGEPPRTPPPLLPRELARWCWRQLTSMRTALILLFLLAVAAVPGSVIPQERLNPIVVAEFVQNHPELARWYGRLGLFDVFGSAWFGAIYLALLVSLLGCIIPRAGQHLRAARARPPAAPRRLERMPEHRTLATGGEPAEALAAAAAVLRRRRFRVVEDPTSVAAERGYLRETGNLLFHVAVVVILVGVAVGSLFGFKGTVIVVEGNGFANAVTQYDGYQAGALAGPDQLSPFALTLRHFEATFQTSGPTQGAAKVLDADLTYTERPGASQREYHLTVNHPLHVGGAEIFLLGHGYAPSFTVRDGNGDVAYSGPWPFLPQDGNYTSTGVIKVPDARPQGLGFQGFFLPTAAVDPRLGPHSVFPGALRPAVYLTAYHGDLRMNNGVPQSIYKLDTSKMKQFQAKGSGSGKEPLRFALTPGQTVRLPGELGSIRFDGYKRWVNLQIGRNPGTPIVFVGAILALAGLLTSLFMRRRRVWVRASPDSPTPAAPTPADLAETHLGLPPTRPGASSPPADLAETHPRETHPASATEGPRGGPAATTVPRTVIDVAGLDRTEGGDLAGELDEIVRQIGARVPRRAEPHEEDQA